MLHTLGYKDKKTYSNNQTLSKKDYCHKRFYIKNVYLSNPFDPKSLLQMTKYTREPAHMCTCGKTGKELTVTQIAGKTFVDK